MDKEGNVNINGLNEIVNFLEGASKEPDFVINHFEGRISMAGMLTDYFVMNDSLILKWNDEPNTFECKSHDEARKLLNHCCKREYLLLMYMYLAEFMHYHDLSDKNFEIIKDLIWDELKNIK